MNRGILQVLAFAFSMFITSSSMAQDNNFEILIRNHVFVPSELVIPAGVKVKLLVKNLDRTPEEFESYELNREKIISGGKQAIIYVGPLKPGRYPFFGEFHQKTAQGVLIAR